MGLPVAARMESAAPPGVAVQLGEKHTVDTQRLVKGGGGIHRILTGHGIHHQQDLCGLHRRLDGLQLVHQGLIDMQPSCGIQKDHVVAVVPGVLDGLLGNVYRVRLTHFKHRDIQLFAHYLQLVDSGRTVHIAGHQQRPLAELSAHQARQLGAVGGLTGTLQTHHHHNGGALGGKGQPSVGAAHQGR
jgi:hypothetical protein